MQAVIRAQLKQIADVLLIGVATRPQEGLRIIDQACVDLVIADFFLDQGTAIEILEHLQHREIKPMIIVTTNAPSVELRERCLSFGASGFFDKMDGFDWLAEAIETARRRSCLFDCICTIRPHAF
jgi:DNA-binding NarL/FixJ family response regulator